MKKFLCVFLIIIFSTTSMVFYSNAQTLNTNDQNKETKVYCNATLDDNFADDSVTVVINEGDSRKLC